MTTPSTKNEEWITDVMDAVISELQRTGYFRHVNGHEPKKAPKGTPTNLHAAVWSQHIGPLAGASGTNSTSAIVVFNARLYSSMIMEPQDAIDPALLRACSAIMRRFHGDFDFEGLIRNVDLLGHFGIPLAGDAGYLEQDGKTYRVYDIGIPCIINDVWPQVLSP